MTYPIIKALQEKRLPEEAYLEAVKNVLTLIELGKGDKNATDFDMFTVWSLTPQGSGYWSGLDKKPSFSNTEEA